MTRNEFNIASKVQLIRSDINLREIENICRMTPSRYTIGKRKLDYAKSIVRTNPYVASIAIISAKRLFIKEAEVASEHNRMKKNMLHFDKELRELEELYMQQMDDGKFRAASKTLKDIRKCKSYQYCLLNPIFTLSGMNADGYTISVNNRTDKELRIALAYGCRYGQETLLEVAEAKTFESGSYGTVHISPGVGEPFSEIRIQYLYNGVKRTKDISIR